MGNSQTVDTYIFEDYLSFNLEDMEQPFKRVKRPSIHCSKNPFYSLHFQAIVPCECRGSSAIWITG